MLKLGFVGWRGMVGSVLLERMIEYKDYKKFKTYFFSGSAYGDSSPEYPGCHPVVLDSSDIGELSNMDVIITTQGSEFTKKTHKKLRDSGWSGYWVDAASALRMNDTSIIPLDPVNYDGIVDGLGRGVKDFIGGNCSITLNLIAISGLLKAGLVDWISSMTYQAASGAGAANMRELLTQMGCLYSSSKDLLSEDHTSILDIDKKVTDEMRSPQFPCEHFQAPLAGSLIPWIDDDLGDGLSKEEWKGDVEATKILGLPNEDLRVDGLCVRVGSMRSHSSALTIKLKDDLDVSEVERILKASNPWLNYVNNNKEETLKQLTPSQASGKDKIFLGRLRKLSVDPQIITAFTVGDQLIWGAAEPLRRMLGIIHGFHVAKD